MAILHAQPAINPPQVLLHGSWTDAEDRPDRGAGFQEMESFSSVKAY